MRWERRNIPQISSRDYPGYSLQRRFSICLFFRTISQKSMQPRSPNLTWKCSTISPGNPFIWRSKGQRSRSRGTKQCRRGCLHSCECWLLLVDFCVRCRDVGPGVTVTAVRYLTYSTTTVPRNVTWCRGAPFSAVNAARYIRPATLRQTIEVVGVSKTLHSTALGLQGPTNANPMHAEVQGADHNYNHPFCTYKPYTFAWYCVKMWAQRFVHSGNPFS